MAATKSPQGYKSEKPWRAALQRAGKRRESGKGNPQWLDRMADACVREAADGNVAAMKEYGDRVEGKPAQALLVDVAVAVVAIERRIIDPVELIAEAVTVQAIEHVIEHDSDGEGEGDSDT